jgi:glycosyltransferase involved in cell wall biosynthesis
MRILGAWRRSRGVAMRVLSLNDASALLHPGGPDETPVAGFERSKPRFIRAAAAALFRCRRGFMLLGLANFLPAALLWRCAAPRLPFALVVHGIEAWRRFGLAERAGLRTITRVIAISEHTRRRFAEVNGVAPDRCRVIHDTLDPEWRRLAEGPCRPRPREIERRPILLSVARLDASEGYKGVDRVIEALPAMARRFPDVLYVVIGDGDDRPRLDRLAAECGVADRVRFLGRVAETTLVDYYRWCDVFVLPSSGEGFGLVYLEAMTCGKPVIGGNHAGSVEVIEDGVCGFLVDHDDTPTLADRARQLLEDADLRRRFGEAGRERAAGRFGFDAISRQWMEAFDEWMELS